jgi:hypothetical protein
MTSAARRPRALIAALTVSLLLIAWLASALVNASSVRAASAAPTQIRACVNDVDGSLRLIADPGGTPTQASPCATGQEHEVDWSLQGPTGPAGDAGAPGAAGPAGPAGTVGTLASGTVAALSASLASAKSQLSALNTQVSADQRDEQGLLDRQQALAGRLPDASAVRARIKRLVGTAKTKELYADVSPLTGTASSWGPGVSADQRATLDSLNEMSEMTSLRLQMAMDRRSKFFEALSNLMKKIAATQQTIVQNLKG